MTGRCLMKMSLALALFVGAAHAASAQNIAAREVLSTFPDAQALFYVNTRRIFDEALPRVVPSQKLEKAFADIQKQSSFDPRSIHFVALGMRYKEPLSMQTPPDFIVLVKGSFNADSLLSLLRVAAEGSYTQEKHGARTINVFNLKKQANKDEQTDAQQAAKPQNNPFPVSEIAAVAIDANTMVFGIPGYVKAAIDATDSGQGRVRADLVDLVARNPDNLMSFGGDIPASLNDLGKGMGVPQNAELERVVRSLRQLQFSVNMNAADFGAQTILRTDTQESAQVIDGFVTIGLGFGRTAIEGQLNKVPANKPREREAMQAALNALETLRHTVNNNELQIDVSVPQATIASFVERAMAEQKSTVGKKPMAKRRGTARRRR